MFEGDVVQLDTTQSVVNSFASGALEIARAGSQANLLQLVRAEDGTGSLEFPSEGVRKTDFVDLVHLMLLARHQYRALDGAGYTGDPAESLLRLVTHRMFVDEVGRVVGRARPAYRECVEVLAAPRGRLEATSLALALHTGRPRIESRFDELSTDTTVLRIVLAGLRVVATDPCPSLFGNLAAPTRMRAIALARQMDSVALLDRERALAAVRRLVLTPLDRPWLRTVELANEVLERRTVLPRPGRARSTHAVAVSLYMDKWWEQCLAGALRILADRGSVLEQVPVPSPWIEIRGNEPLDADESPADDSLDASSQEEKTRHVDLMFELRGATIIADAKYKLNSGALAAGDGYQVFAYSHTARSGTNGRLSDAAAILYPSRSPGSIYGGRLGGRRLRRATAPNYEARLLGLPFPAPSDLGSDVAWKSYLRRLADALELGLQGIASRPEAGTSDQPAGLAPVFE